jgi:WD40 repeat protein
MNQKRILLFVVVLAGSLVFAMMSLRTCRFPAKGSSDASLITVDPDSGKQEYAVGGQLGKISRLCSSPDGRFLAWSELSLTRTFETRNQHILHVWSIAKHQLVYKLTSSDQITAIMFSPDGNTLAVSDFSKGTRLLNSESEGQETPLGKFQHEDEAAEGLAFSSDGRRVATGEFTKQIYIWDIFKVNRRHLGQTLAIPTHLVFSSTNEFLAVADSNSHIFVWDLNKQEICWSFRAHIDPFTGRTGVQGLAFLPNTTELISAGTDGEVCVWDVPTKKEINHFDGKVGEIDALALSPKGDVVAIAGKPRSDPAVRGLVRLWRIGSKDIVASRESSDAATSCLCFSADGSTLVLGENNDDKGRVTFWPIGHFLVRTPSGEK